MFIQSSFPYNSIEAVQLGEAEAAETPARFQAQSPSFTKVVFTLGLLVIVGVALFVTLKYAIPK
jgi:hypothetical protein